MFTFPSKEHAELAAAKMERRMDQGIYSRVYHGRRHVKFAVEQYPDGNIHDKLLWSWGIVWRWVYDDQPGLGEFGGAFIFFLDQDPRTLSHHSFLG